MNLRDFKGNALLKSQLSAHFSKGLPSSILLTGAPLSGKRTLARQIAAALLCTGSGEKPCGGCNSCHKLAHNSHPDFQMMDIEEKEISVAVSRQIRSDCMVRPNDGDKKVYILAHGQNMNPSAQNALLKTLEEPPHYAYFIITAENMEGLLQTILSRCSIYHVSPLSYDELQAALSQSHNGHPQLHEAAAASYGILGQAIAYLDREKDEDAALAIDFAKAVFEASEFAMASCCSGFEKLPRPRFEALLARLMELVHSCVLVQTDLPCLGVYAKAAAELAPKIETTRFLRFYDFLDGLSIDAGYNASVTAMATVLAAKGYEIFYGNARA